MLFCSLLQGVGAHSILNVKAHWISGSFVGVMVNNANNFYMQFPSSINLTYRLY